MLLERYFVDVINIYDQLLWIKEIALNNVRGLVQSEKAWKSKDRFVGEQGIVTQKTVNTEILPNFPACQLVNPHNCMNNFLK